MKFLEPKIIFLLCVGLGMLFLTTSCGSKKCAQYPSHRKTFTGTASWYGKKFHGRKMTNGERYDMNKLTAAHRHLPFGTQVRVTNLANNQSVVVRITDRGPHNKSRVIDLSRRAAEKLGYIRKGVARVRVDVLD